MRTLLAVFSMLTAACAHNSQQRATQRASTDEPAVNTRANDADAALSDGPDRDASACDERAHPTLTDYSDVREGALFSLRVRREPSGAWLPVEQLRMPMHHASSLVFTPSLDTLVSEGDRGRTILVVATGVGRTSINHDQRRNTWFATYTARVEQVCPIAP